MSQDDPVVQRVRAARRKIAEQCGHDNHRLLEWARRIEAANPGRVVRLERINGAPKSPNTLRE